MASEPKTIIAKTLASMTRREANKLCADMYNQFQQMRTARSAREVQWQELDKILGMEASSKGKVKSSYGSNGLANQGIASPELQRLDSIIEEEMQRQTGQKPTKIKADSKSLDRVQEMFNTQAALAKSSFDTYITNLMMTLFPIGQENLYVQQYDKLEPQRAMALQSLMRNVYDLIGLKQQSKKVFKEFSKYGTCIPKYEWVTETKELLVKIPDKKSAYTLTEKVTYNGPKITAVPLQEIFFDTTSSRPEEGLIIQKKMMTVDEILDNPNYDQRDEFERNDSWRFDLLPGQTARAWDSEGMSLTQLLNSVPKVNKKIDVFECWGDFIIPNIDISQPPKVYRNYVFEFTRFEIQKANREKPTVQALRFEPNPYGFEKPFIIVQPYEDSASHYAKSPYENARPHFEKLAGLNTAAKDMISQSASRPNIINMSMLQPESQQKLNTEPMTSDMVLGVINLVPGQSLENVMTRPRDDQGQAAAAAMQLASMTEQHVRQLIGETESMNGGAAPQYMKTGVALAYQQGSQNRLAETARTVEDQYLVPLARKTIQYLSLFMSQGGVIITDKGSLTLEGPVDYADLGAQVIFKGSTYAANNQLDTNNIINMYQNTVSSPMATILGEGILLRMFKSILVRLNIAEADDIVPQQIIEEKAPPRLGLVAKLKGMFIQNPNLPQPAPPAEQGQPLTNAPSQTTV